MKQINVNGLSINYRQKGQGAPLLLLHGGVSDSRFWQREIDVFSDAYNVLAWDAPGCGQSDNPPENFSLNDYADTLGEFLSKLGIIKAHVLGISFGGGLAISFFNRHSEIPSTLMLISAYAGWAGSLPAEEVERRLEKGRKQTKMDPEAVAEMWIPTQFSSTPTKEMIQEEKEIISDFHPVGSQIMLEAFAKADLRDVLPEIDVPTLLLYGEEDIRSPLKVAQELESNIPLSKLVILPGVGHLVNKETPELFDRHVREFLKEHGK
jgi:pimeloyl-ACP methyl ester carboxylesterase